MRVRLISFKDPYTILVPGLEGTINFIDDFKTIHVSWDNHLSLGLVPGIDEYELLVL